VSKTVNSRVASLASILRSLQKFRQLGDIGGDAPRFAL
jgi:hypothetical protein